MEIKKGFTVKTETPHGMLVASKFEEGNHQGLKISLEAPWLDKPITLAVVECNTEKGNEGIAMHFREDAASKKGTNVLFQNYLSCVTPSETVCVSLMGNRKLLGLVVNVEANGDFTISDMSNETTHIERFDIIGIKKVKQTEDWMNSTEEIIISLGGATSALYGRIKRTPANGDESFTLHTLSGKDFRVKISDVKAAYVYIRE